HFLPLPHPADLLTGMPATLRDDPGRPGGKTQLDLVAPPLVMRGVPDAKAPAEVVFWRKVLRPQKLRRGDAQRPHPLHRESPAGLALDVVADQVPAPIDFGEVEGPQATQFPFLGVDLAVLEAQLPTFQNGAGDGLEETLV